MRSKDAHGPHPTPPITAKSFGFKLLQVENPSRRVCQSHVFFLDTLTRQMLISPTCHLHCDSHSQTLETTARSSQMAVLKLEARTPTSRSSSFPSQTQVRKPIPHSACAEQDTVNPEHHSLLGSPPEGPAQQLHPSALDLFPFPPVCSDSNRIKEPNLREGDRTLWCAPNASRQSNRLWDGDKNSDSNIRIPWRQSPSRGAAVAYCPLKGALPRTSGARNG